MFALMDCNNFYASCERVFNPRLEGKPIVILSNNDGCIIARSNEAKHLGIPMGAPFFEWREYCQQHRVHVFSSNYALYGDLSQRVMSSLATFCPTIEIYSIDEAFLLFEGMTSAERLAYAADIRRAIKMWTGIPVSIGIAPTKTLAKVANYQAKKHTITGVFDLSQTETQEKILAQFPVQELWGIGRNLSKTLNLINIHTAKELRDANQKIIRSQFSVVMERMIQELRGISCLPLETVQARKQIISSRSFGKAISRLSDIEEALSHYTANACLKLRQQNSTANGITVFLNQNIHHSVHLTYSFPTPSCDTSYIIKMAKKCLQKLFKPGLRYHKTGIILLDLGSRSINQFDLFTDTNNTKSNLIMKTVDTINEKMGKTALFRCAEGTERAWRIRCDKRSPRYTTHWDELVRVHCCHPK